MIVARTLASAVRSCIQRCRQSRGQDLNLRHLRPERNQLRLNT